jgi:hypothetical protein
MEKMENERRERIKKANGVGERGGEGEGQRFFS